MTRRIGRLVVVPAQPAFQARYPGIELMLGLGDKDVNLVQESVDSVVRIGALPDSSLVERRLGTLEMVTVASPAYLLGHGTQSSINDLEKHLAINYLSRRTKSFRNMHFMVDDKRTEVRMRSALAINEADAYVACATMGLGIVQVPLFVAQSHLARGELVEILPDARPTPLPVSVGYPHHRHLSPQVRTFVDWIAEHSEQSAPLKHYAISRETRAFSRGQRDALIDFVQRRRRTGVTINDAEFSAIRAVAHREAQRGGLRW